MPGIIVGGSVVARYTAPLQVVSNRHTLVNDTLSLRRKAAVMAAQRWEIQTGIEPLSDSAAADLSVLLITSGPGEVIDCSMPQLYRLNGRTTLTSLVVNTAAVAGAPSVPVTLSGTRLAKGEFIQFAGHTKVYLVLQQLTASGSLQLFPNLVANVAVGESILYGDSVSMKARFDTDTVFGMQYQGGRLMEVGQLKLIEAL
jgi:hypothetical protein